MYIKRNRIRLMVMAQIVAAVRLTILKNASAVNNTGSSTKIKSASVSSNFALTRSKRSSSLSHGRVDHMCVKCARASAGKHTCADANPITKSAPAWGKKVGSGESLTYGQLGRCSWSRCGTRPSPYAAKLFTVSVRAAWKLGRQICSSAMQTLSITAAHSPFKASPMC